MTGSKRFHRRRWAHEMQRLLITPTLAFGLVGCIPYKVPAWIDAPVRQSTVAQDADEKLKVGDKIRMRTIHGKTYRFEIVELTDDGFIGEQHGRYRYRYRYKDVKWIEVKRSRWDFAILGPSRL